MKNFDPALRDYVEQRLAEASHDVFQISRADDLNELQFRPVRAPDSPSLVKSGGYSLMAAGTPISFHFPAMIERALVGPYGHQVNMPHDNWNVCN